VEVYKIPIGDIAENSINYLILHFKPLFVSVESSILFVNGCLKMMFLLVPPWGIIAMFVFLSWRLMGRKKSLFTLMSLLLLWNLGLWTSMMLTLSLVITAVCFSLLVAIPLGILAAESRLVGSLLRPVLDFLQAMPRFIYLIPGVVAFGIDTVPGIVATMTLAIPPPVRLTALGLTQIDKEVIEAGEAFGCNRWKLLCKIKFPLAIPSIMLGINQCIMMSLSMVVIAALIGAGGLGADIVYAINRLLAGTAIVAGLGVVVLAILIDRLSKGLIAKRIARLRGRKINI